MPWSEKLPPGAEQAKALTAALVSRARATNNLAKAIHQLNENNPVADFGRKVLESHVTAAKRREYMEYIQLSAAAQQTGRSWEVHQRLLQDFMSWLQFRGQKVDENPNLRGFLDEEIKAALTRLSLKIPVESLRVKTSEMPSRLGADVWNFITDADLAFILEAIKNQPDSKASHGYSRGDITRVIEAGWRIEIIRDSVAPAPFVPTEAHERALKAVFKDLSAVWEKAKSEDVTSYYKKPGDIDYYVDWFWRKDSQQRHYPILAMRALERAYNGQGDPTFQVEKKHLSKETQRLMVEVIVDQDSAAYFNRELAGLMLFRWLELSVKLAPEVAAQAIKNGWGFRIK